MAWLLSHMIQCARKIMGSILDRHLWPGLVNIPDCGETVIKGRYVFAPNIFNYG